ncbi:MAG: sigma-70 family RNA polymerase sigma factor [Vicinamibacterales bacterium]
MFRRRDSLHTDAGGFAMDDALALMNGLYGTAVRLTRNGDAARDLVQETYLKAIRARERFQPGTNLKAWLYTILHNTWRNSRRDAARARVSFDSDTLDLAVETGKGGLVDDETPEASLLKRAADVEIREALDALPAVFREAVWLRDVEDLSYSEIADALAVPIGTVMSRISRGRKLLHAALRERLAQARPSGVAVGEGA